MDNATIQEIAAIWDKINDINKTLSDFIDMVHGQSTDSIGENSDCILDVAEISDENSTSISDLEAAMKDLDERVKALEGK